LTEWPIGSRFEWICLNRSSGPSPSGKNRANWQPWREENKNHPAQKRLRGSYYNKNNLRSLYSSRSTCIRRMEKRLNSSLSRSRSLRPNEKDLDFFQKKCLNAELRWQVVAFTLHFGCVRSILLPPMHPPVCGTRRFFAYEETVDGRI